MGKHDKKKKRKKEDDKRKGQDKVTSSRELIVSACGKFNHILVWRLLVNFVLRFGVLHAVVADDDCKDGNQN
jgi:hypothetical protein